MSCSKALNSRPLNLTHILSPTVVASMLTIRPWPNPSKLIVTSWIVSHTGHNYKLITGEGKHDHDHLYQNEPLILQNWPVWPWACGSVWPVHSYIDVADLHRLTIRYNSAWPEVPPPWPWDLGARSATPLWNNGKHGNMSKVHTMHIKNMENQSWVLIIYTTVSGIAWLCTFSLLAHSNSKRHMKIIHFSLFHIEGQIKLGQYREKGT